MWAPNETGDSTGITANLLLDQAPVPEPSSLLSVMAAGGLLCARRRRVVRSENAPPTG
jgi:hypothetical protein